MTHLAVEHGAGPHWGGLLALEVLRHLQVGDSHREHEVGQAVHATLHLHARQDALLLCHRQYGRRFLEG